ncbi:MAG: EamA family transporter, partial [Planctomycetota bacterium]
MNNFDSAARAAMKEQTRGYYCAIIAVLLWSTVASAFKISLRHLSVLPLLFYASVVSTGILFCLLLFLKKLKMLRTLTRRGYLRSALL